MQKRSLPIGETDGCVAGESVMCYPPGIPILAPGELITKDIINHINYAKEKAAVSRNCRSAGNNIAVLCP